MLDASDDNAAFIQSAKRIPFIEVEEDVIQGLNDHHMRLKGYLKGYLVFRQVRRLAEGVRSTIDDPDQKKDPGEYLKTVRNRTEEIRRVFVGNRNRRDLQNLWQTDFGESLAQLNRALDEALGLLERSEQETRAAPDLRVVDRDLRSLTNTIITTASEIESTCEERSQEELEGLGSYVHQIFRKPRKEPAPEPSKEAMSSKLYDLSLRALDEGRNDPVQPQHRQQPNKGQALLEPEGNRR